MSLVLLLNLLIAMMGDTYQTTQAKGKLDWHVDYARRLLRLELQVSFLHRMGWVNLNCGEKQPDPATGETAWVFNYKIYERNAEGSGGARGKKSSSMFDESVEDEAMLHEQVRCPTPTSPSPSPAATTAPQGAPWLLSCVAPR